MASSRSGYGLYVLVGPEDLTSFILVLWGKQETGNKLPKKIITWALGSQGIYDPQGS